MKLKNLYAIFIVCCLLSACAGDEESSLSEFAADPFVQTGIVGAERVSPGDRGYKATVSLRRNGSAFCTGTLIGRRVILTAAHCLKGMNSYSNISAVFSADPSSVAYSIVRVISHKDFNAKKAGTGFFADYSHDVAVVGISSNAPKEAVVALLPSRPLPAGKYNLKTFGVGQTSGKAPSSSGPMRMVNLRGEVKKNRERMVSYDQRNGKGFCDGDSGGPHFMYDSKSRPTVMAISTSVDFAGVMGKSFGDKCRYYSNATQIGYYSGWIQQAQATLESQLANYYVD